MPEMILLSPQSEATLFKSIGFLVHVVKDEDEVREIMTDLDEAVKIVAYDTSLSSVMHEFTNKQKDIYPLFLPLPFTKKDSGKVINDVKEDIKKSIGIDLL